MSSKSYRLLLNIACYKLWRIKLWKLKMSLLLNAIFPRRIYLFEFKLAQIKI